MKINMPTRLKIRSVCSEFYESPPLRKYALQVMGPGMPV